MSHAPAWRCRALAPLRKCALASVFLLPLWPHCGGLCVSQVCLCSIFRRLGHHHRFGVSCVVLCSASFLFCALRVDVVAVFGQTRCRCRTALMNSQTLSRNQRASRLMRTSQHLKELELTLPPSAQARNSRCRVSKNCLSPS